MGREISLFGNIILRLRWSLKDLIYILQTNQQSTLHLECSSRAFYHISSLICKIVYMHSCPTSTAIRKNWFFWRYENIYAAVAAAPAFQFNICGIFKNIISCISLQLTTLSQTQFTFIHNNFINSVCFLRNLNLDIHKPHKIWCSFIYYAM